MLNRRHFKQPHRRPYYLDWILKIFLRIDACSSLSTLTPCSSRPKCLDRPTHVSLGYSFFRRSGKTTLSVDRLIPSKATAQLLVAVGDRVPCERLSYSVSGFQVKRQDSHALDYS